MKISQLKELVRQVVKEESDYQEMFKAMLDKTGKSLPSMSDSEKKAFFNAVDKAATAKTEGKLRGYKEGNAFGAAVADAKKDGDDEFKVGGKEYKVESVNETKFFAFFNNKKYEIEGKDLLDAKQKAILQLKVPKSKVGLLAIVNASEHEKGSFKFESANERVQKKK